jgi:NADPH-dependent 2,4-dienoyl-CoA reductase/sulfur reductase-like enzyme
MKKHDLVIIGGGPAGLAAAVAARESGIEDILIIERDVMLGGILNQCIHSGFGLHVFDEELTGPEYAARYIDQVDNLNIPYITNTMVLNVTPDKIVTVLSREGGLLDIQAKAIILAMGCRERPRGALLIPGYRPAGIYTAGTAQRLVNMEGFMPGKDIVILGSGDIGLIMARRLTLEGANVKVVAELLSYSSGLKRNIVQCLNDFNIPLKFNHTVIDISGYDRLESVTIAEVDQNRKPIPGTEQVYTCDTLLLSCGLIPENELSTNMGIKMNASTNGPVVDSCLETEIPGVFACGNVLHVHDLVDFVSYEASRAGQCAALYIQGSLQSSIRQKAVPVETEGGVRYTVPFLIDPLRVDSDITLRFRVNEQMSRISTNLYVNGKRVTRKRRLVVTPGEMEELVFPKRVLEETGVLERVLVTIEE